MKQKDVLIIIILLFIFALVWIGGSIYHSAVSSTISEKINKDISPIAPNFDTKTIETLRERQRTNPIFELGGATPAPPTLPATTTIPVSATEGGKLPL